MPSFTSRVSLISPPRVERLIDAGMLRPLHIDDHQALLAAGDIGIGARDIDIASVFERHRRARNHLADGPAR